MPYNHNGSGAFAPSGVCYKIEFTDDSSLTAVEISAATAVQVLADQNVAIAFSATDDSYVPYAEYPTANGQEGTGCVVQANWQTLLALPQVAAYNTSGKMYVSVAGAAAGNCWITLGDLV